MVKASQNDDHLVFGPLEKRTSNVGYSNVGYSSPLGIHWDLNTVHFEVFKWLGIASSSHLILSIWIPDHLASRQHSPTWIPDSYVVWIPIVHCRMTEYSDKRIGLAFQIFLQKKSERALTPPNLFSGNLNSFDKGVFIPSLYFFDWKGVSLKSCRQIWNKDFLKVGIQMVNQMCLRWY